MNTPRTLLTFLGLAAAAVLAVHYRSDAVMEGGGRVVLIPALPVEESGENPTKAASEVDVAGSAATPGRQAVGGRLPEDPEPEVAVGALAGAQLSVLVYKHKDSAKTLSGFRFNIVLAQNVGMNRWRDLETLAEAKTDLSGTWEGDVERPEVLDPGQYLIVRVREPGYQDRAAVFYHEVREDSTTPMRASLGARAGSSAKGRVVDAEGEGVEARIQFARASQVARSSKFTSSFSCSTDADGHFELFLEENPTHDRGGLLEGTLTATAETGNAALVEQRWPLANPPQDLTLTVGGDGALSGVVRDEAGAPAAAVPLLVVLEDLVRDGRNLQFVGQRALDRHRGDGRVAVRPVTDADGRFDVRGLRLARYSVRVIGGHRFMRSTEVVLTNEPVLADGRELELVHSQRSLRLVLLKADGDPWLGKVEFAPVDRQAPHLPHAWPDVPTVLVTSMLSEGDQFRFEGDPRRSISGRRLPDGSIVFDPGSSEALEIRVLGGSEESGFFHGRPIHLRAATDKFLMSQVVRAELLASELGTVNLRVLTVATPEPDLDYFFVEKPGEDQPLSPATTLTPFTTSDSYRLIVTDAGTGAPILEPEDWTTVAPWSLQLPAGRYRLRPWRSPNGYEFHHGTQLPLAPEGEDWVFEVRAGETTDFEVESAAGVQIELTISGQGGENPKSYAWPVLVGADGNEAPLYRLDYRHQGIGPTLTTTWTIGKPQLCLRVAAGRYQLRCTVMPSGREIEHKVKLVDGETLRLKL